MVTEFLQPSCNIVVGLVLADIVDEKRAHSATIVCGGDCPVPFLAGGIPDLGFDCLSIDLDGSGREFDADGRLRVQVELIASESAQQVRLPDSRVSNEHHYSRELGYNPPRMRSASTAFRGGLVGEAIVFVPLKRNCKPS